MLADDDVDDLAWHVDELLDGFPGHEGWDAFCGEGFFAGFFFCRFDAQPDATADLAVHLHGHFHFVVDAERGLVAWPGLERDGGRVAPELPDFFRHVGREGRDAEEKRCRSFFRQLFQRRELVQEHHHRGDGRVERKVLDVLGDLFDRPMNEPFCCVVDGVDRGPREHGEHAIAEAHDALDLGRLPRFHSLQGAHEHLVEPQTIGAVGFDDIVGVDDVAARFRHFFAVFAQD